jgi:hypothetical protein
MGGLPAENLAMHQHDRLLAGRTFIDLLDAQSEVRPSSFRVRVQATGAKDYGEDVADRNMAINGYGLPSMTNSHPPLPTKRAPRRGDQGSHQDSQHRQYLNAAHSERRTKSLTTEARQARVVRTFSLTPRAVTNPRFVPHSGQAPLDERGSVRPRRGRLANLSGQFHECERPTPDIRVNGVRASLQPSGNFDAQANPGGLDFLSEGEESEAAVHGNCRTQRPLSGDSFDDSYAETLRARESQHTTPRNSQYEPSAPLPSAASLHSSKRQSLATTQPSRSSSTSSRTPALNPTALGYPRDGRKDSRVQQLDPEALIPRDNIHIKRYPKLDDDEAAPPPSIKAGPHRRHERIFGQQGLPSHSIVTMEGSGEGDQAWHENGNGSISSSAPTTASSSGNLSPRPNSLHTANTSVDMSHRTGSCHDDADEDENENEGADEDALQHRRSEGAATRSQDSNFNIDDYVSDDDSFVGSPHLRGEGDEGLLFRNGGYGFDADRLPGLFDGSEPASVDGKGLQSPDPSAELAYTRLESGRRHLTAGSFDESLDGVHSRQRRHYVLDVDADEFGDAEEADEDFTSDFDGAYGSHFEDAHDKHSIRRGLSPVRRPRTSTRSSAIGMHPPPLHRANDFGQTRKPQAKYQSVDFIEEEVEAKVDVATAVQLRKEAKARLRVRVVTAKPIRNSDTLGVGRTRPSTAPRTGR